MPIYHLSTHPDSRFGGIVDWSETTQPRKPDRDAQRWYASDSDGFALGPLPDVLRSRMAEHWALVDFGGDALPDGLNSLTSRHFTGLQALGPKLAQVFREYAGAEAEFVPIPQMWSRSDDARIDAPFVLANVYGAEPTIDLDHSDHIEVKNPKLIQANAVAVTSTSPTYCKIKHGFSTHRHIWRDTATSEWFCGEAFRDALEVTSPGNYLFTEMVEAPKKRRWWLF